MRSIQGIPASPGYAAGPAFRLVAKNCSAKVKSGGPGELNAGDWKMLYIVSQNQLD
jgi:hypothetical protein